MKERLSDWSLKEVIDLDTGARLGRVRDAEIEPESGRVLSLILPGKLRSLGLLGREDELVIPWQHIAQVGEDIIFVRLGDKRNKKYSEDL